MANIPDMAERPDYLGNYLIPELKDLLYDSLSEEYCSKAELDFLVDVPLPFKAEDLVSFKEEGLPVTKIVDNMILTLGANTNYKYIGAYMQFFAKFFDQSILDIISKNGMTELRAEHYKKACIYFRAALVLAGSENPDLLFDYAYCCRAWYLSMEGDEDQMELIALLKSEANLYFEYTAECDVNFAPAWYFMGYTYLNEGLYMKANAAWSHYLKLREDDPVDEALAEIRERVESLKDPIRIEEGINEMMAGRFKEGLEILEPYTETGFTEWWPLHFYLALAYRELGFNQEAIEGFRKVIALAPSQLDSNCALAELYEEIGDAENAEKYAKKAELLKKDMDPEDAL